MAIDTLEKRQSAINVSSPWRSIFPIPDGTVHTVDRICADFMYSGILAGLYPLIAAFIDSMAAWDDTPEGFFTHDGSILEDWSQLADFLRLRLTGAGGMAGMLDTYIIIGLNQGGNQGPSIGSM